MKCYYSLFTGKSDLDLVENLSSLFQENEICIQDFSRAQAGPMQHFVEAWYYRAEDIGFRTYYTSFFGPSSDYITSSALSFLENAFPGGTGLCYSNRDVLSPSEHLLDVWYSSAEDMGGTGGFISFKGQTFLDTAKQVRSFFDQPGGINEFFQQRTVVGPGQYIIDVTYLAVDF
jgi:hypothetical protein